MEAEERQDFEKLWLNSTVLLDRLKELIEKRISQIELDRDSEYDNPSWAYYRADKNGQQKALESIYSLLP